MWQILTVLAALCQPLMAEVIIFDGDSKEQSHWGYVIGIIAFILVLQAIGLGIEFWYKKKLNEFLAQTGQGQDVRTED